MHPIFVAQGNAADLALVWHSKASRRGAHALSQVSAAQPTARRSNDDSERTRRSLAWLTASATMRDTPSAVSEQASVGSGRMKRHDIRTLRKVSDEADAVLLVLDAHNTNRGRGKLVEERVRGGGHAARVCAQQDWSPSSPPFRSSLACSRLLMIPPGKLNTDHPQSSLVYAGVLETRRWHELRVIAAGSVNNRVGGDGMYPFYGLAWTSLAYAMQAESSRARHGFSWPTRALSIRFSLEPINTPLRLASATGLDQSPIQLGTADALPNATESPASNVNFGNIAISVHASVLAATALVRGDGEPLWDISRVDTTGRKREVEFYPGSSFQVAVIILEKIKSFVDHTS
ncbi:hypothetical protein EDB85DRAFT_1892968 [Lactarius pseudohatsudake]|nr:hypothetical protein EDB85DRAFT_1892968 [Lactarius pseudohatsudake]